jgi:flagellar basal-body rod protein FlgG
MQSGYYSATGGMVAQFHKLDTTANNLANLNTAGFKKDSLVFGDYLRVSQGKRDELPLETNTREGSKFLNRATARVPSVIDHFSDFSTGALKQTDSPLDIAITESDLFITVQTPDGLKLTKNGSLIINDEGYLSTKDGFEVVDARKAMPIKIDNKHSINIDENGVISNGLGEDKNQMLLVRPEDLRTLRKEGNGLFTPINEEELIAVEDSGAVAQFYIETSNVNSVLEMTSLIEANRLVGMYQKVMDTQMNDVNRDAIEKLATTRV